MSSSCSIQPNHCSGQLEGWARIAVTSQPRDVAMLHPQCQSSYNKISVFHRDVVQFQCTGFFPFRSWCSHRALVSLICEPPFPGHLNSLVFKGMPPDLLRSVMSADSLPQPWVKIKQVSGNHDDMLESFQHNWSVNDFTFCSFDCSFAEVLRQPWPNCESRQMNFRS